MSDPSAVRIADACTVIGVYATGLFDSLIGALPYGIQVTEQSLAEALYIYDRDQATGGSVRIAIDLAPPFASGILLRTEPTPGPELSQFLSLAARLGDGEAASIAVAAARGIPLVTDDRKARKIALQVDPAIQLYTTTQILREGTTLLGLSPTQVQQVLEAVRTRARFAPPEDDPDRLWWDASI